MFDIKLCLNIESFSLTFFVPFHPPTDVGQKTGGDAWGRGTKRFLHRHRRNQTKAIEEEWPDFLYKFHLTKSLKIWSLCRQLLLSDEEEDFLDEGKNLSRLKSLKSPGRGRFSLKRKKDFDWDPILYANGLSIFLSKYPLIYPLSSHRQSDRLRLPHGLENDRLRSAFGNYDLLTRVLPKSTSTQPADAGQYASVHEWPSTLRGP